MQVKRGKEDYYNDFKELYVQILKRSKPYAELYKETENKLISFKTDHVMDNNSIEFLPAYFNMIECLLAQNDQLAQVKQYLIVCLTNLLNASKKVDEKGMQNQRDEYQKDEVHRKLLQSKLDLLFGRYNILMRSKGEEAINKLTSSIISYSELYGPENVGLTQQYYYLADYMLDYIEPKGEQEERLKKITVKRIYSKIADMWRMYFNGTINPLFLYNEDDITLLAIGETFVKMISNRIANVFPRNSECELDLKFKMIKAMIFKKTGSDYYNQARTNALEYLNKIENNIKDKEFMSDMTNLMKIEEGEAQY